MNQTPNSTLADPQQIIADLQRELAECRTERDEALARRPKRRIKTQTVLPSAETAAMLFSALLAAGQITMRKVDGWQTLTHKLADEPIDLVADAISSFKSETALNKFQHK